MVLDDHDLLDRAITQAYERATQIDEKQQSELTGIQDKLAETRAAMDRYFRAFEAGSMPEDTCAPRIASLSEQAKALETRASELATLNEDEQPERTTPADLDTLRSKLRAALNNSTPARAKTTLQAMIHNLVTASRLRQPIATWRCAPEHDNVNPCGPADYPSIYPLSYPYVHSPTSPHTQARLPRKSGHRTA